jgi:hypothetical protein
MPEVDSFTAMQRFSPTEDIAGNILLCISSTERLSGSKLDRFRVALASHNIQSIPSFREGCEPSQQSELSQRIVLQTSK